MYDTERKPGAGHETIHFFPWMGLNIYLFIVMHACELIIL